MKMKNRRKAMVIALALAMALAAALPAFAEGDTAANSTASGGAAANATSSDGITPGSEAEAIAKYGTYNGPNAVSIPVLAYHNVVTDAKKKKNGSSIVISASKFNRQMKFLYDNGYRTISCEELYLWHEGKILLPPRSVLITFDNGYKGVANIALPILQQYGMKGTEFLIGTYTYNNKKGYISYSRMKELRTAYPGLEFQSHTYDLHKQLKEKGSYKKVLRDAVIMKNLIDPEYVAYPYGKYTKGMIKAYRQTGIKMAFTYGKDGYATRDQDLYKIKRISVNGNASFKKFKKWIR